MLVSALLSLSLFPCSVKGRRLRWKWASEANSLVFRCGGKQLCFSVNEINTFVFCNLNGMQNSGFAFKPPGGGCSIGASLVSFINASSYSKTSVTAPSLSQSTRTWLWGALQLLPLISLATRVCVPPPFPHPWVCVPCQGTHLHLPLSFTLMVAHVSFVESWPAETQHIISDKSTLQAGHILFAVVSCSPDSFL